MQLTHRNSDRLRQSREPVKCCGLVLVPKERRKTLSKLPNIYKEVIHAQNTPQPVRFVPASPISDPKMPLASLTHIASSVLVQS